MKTSQPALAILVVTSLSLSYLSLAASKDQPYKILKTTQTMGTGPIDYVYADSDGRKLYIPRGSQVLVFDLDSLNASGSITNARARGAAVDPKSHHGFCSSSPVVMWDTQSLKTVKTIDVQGRPDGIYFEPLTERVYVFSHSQPNATVLDSKDGSVVGTIDLGGAPEQAASDGKGRMYVDLEDKDKIAVVDVKSLKVVAQYDLNGKGGGGGGFNPATGEAFSSQRDGTLTIVKENSPTSFEIEQTVQTRPGAKTCSLDT